MKEKIIEINNLTKNYGKARGVTEVSFNVEKGEIFGFIGPNGAGKSTTIRSILSLIKPTSGEIKVFGMDSWKCAPEIAKNIGYLPSEVFYYDNMKVIDLLNYSASFYNKDCTEKMNKLVKEFELDLNKKIEDLSYGNKKKVGIIQGLLHEPDLIILDEPTSGLDPLMQQKFFKILEAENKRGATILFSSHILSEVQRLCDRVCIIKEGKIISIKKISELEKESYKKIRLEIMDKITKKDLNYEGINNLEIDNNKITFLYKGNIDSLIKKISKFNVKDIWIEDPSLEEIFLHYYE